MTMATTRPVMISIEPMLGIDGKPRVWGDGSPVRLALGETGLLVWDATIEANPWLIEHCMKRGREFMVELEKKLGDQKCYDCGALPGHYHDPGDIQGRTDGCDEETCPICGHQLISCHCTKDEAFYAELQDLGGPIPWSGLPNGHKEAIECGFWCKWSLLPPTEQTHYQTSGWIQCSKDEQGARIDFARLHRECVWDKRKRKWIRQPIVTSTSEGT